MDKIKSFFKTNLLLKIVSLAVAFAIWLIVVNISNPEVNVTFTSSIEVDYGESLTSLDKYYSLDTTSAKVSFNVRSNQRRFVSSEDFKVYVDMRDFSITGALPVYVVADDSIKDIISNCSVSPLVVHATTEDMQEKTFDLSADYLGEPAEGFAAAEATVSPNRVTLYGPNSEIGKISRVGFNIDISGATDSIWGTAEFIFYDANNNPIAADVRIVVKNSVSYFVPVYRKKNVSITVQTNGEPKEGYTVESVKCEPNFIEVYGEDSVLQKVNAIILPSYLLNVTDASADVFNSIDIKNYLPDGLYSDTVKNVALIAKISRTGLLPPMLDSPEDTQESTEGDTDLSVEGSDKSESAAEQDAKVSEMEASDKDASGEEASEETAEGQEKDASEKTTSGQEKSSSEKASAGQKKDSM